MLDEPAAKAKAMVLAERPTQPATDVDVLDSLEDYTWTMAGQVVKKLAFNDEKGSGPSGCPKKVDSEVTVNEDIAPEGVLECPMEQTAMRSLGRSEPQGSGMLRQMNFFKFNSAKIGTTNAGCPMPWETKAEWFRSRKGAKTGILQA